MRLIDADALPKYTGYALSADEVAKAVENAPTIEAEPVRRGRWGEGINDKWVCSECGTGNNYAYSWDITGYQLQDRYCPNCGAKMEASE